MSSQGHDKKVLSIQYFLYFGVLGIFLPYFNLYCFHLGFNGFQIGMLSAVRTLTTVFFPLFWGALSDRYRMRRPIYIVCNAVSTAIWGLLLLTADFWQMLLISAFYGVFYAPIIAFLEAFTMDILGNERRQYGRIRMWGSINFVVVVVVVGRLVDQFSTQIIIGLIFGGSVIQALVSFGVPPVRTLRTASFARGAAAMGHRRVLVFLICAFVMLVSHGTYYGFFSIHLEAVGYGKTFIGVAWAVATIAEILVMLKSDAIFRRFSVESVMVFSFAAAVIRWLILATTTAPVVVIGTQVIHAFTYGAFHIASILYIDHLVPAEAKTFGQAVNNAVTYGLGITAGFMLNGILFEAVGAFGLFLMSAGIAAGGGLLFAVFTRGRRAGVDP